MFKELAASAHPGKYNILVRRNSYWLHAAGAREDGGREHSLFFKSRLFFNEILNRCSRISQDSEFYFGTSEESWRDWLFQNI